MKKLLTLAFAFLTCCNICTNIAMAIEQPDFTMDNPASDAGLDSIAADMAGGLTATESVSTTGDCEEGKICTNLTMPIDGETSIGADSGIELFQKYASYIYKMIVQLVGLIAVLIMVISGVQMMTAGANSSAYDEAKGRIIRTLSGIALLFCMGVLLYTINPIYFTI